MEDISRAMEPAFLDPKPLDLLAHLSGGDLVGGSLGICLWLPGKALPTVAPFSPPCSLDHRDTVCILRKASQGPRAVRDSTENVCPNSQFSR